VAQKKKTKNNKVKREKVRVRSSQPSFIKLKLTQLFTLPDETKKWIWGIIVFILAIIFALSFFELAGVAGVALMNSFTFLIGRVVFGIPLIFILGGLVFFNAKHSRFLGPTMLSIIILIFGLAGLWGSFNPEAKQGGWIGFVLSFPFLELFGSLVSRIVFVGVIAIGC